MDNFSRLASRLGDSFLFPYAGKLVTIFSSSFLLFISTLLVGLLFALVGGAVWLHVRQRFASCAILFPSVVTGFAVVALIAGFLSTQGIAVKHSGYLVIVLVLTGYGLLFYRWKRTGFQRIDWKSFTVDGASAAAFAVILLGSAALLYLNGSNSFGAAWGSVDFGGGWVSADYLLQFGGNETSFAAQKIFAAGGSMATWVFHIFRYGALVCLAFIGFFVGSDNLHVSFIPLLVLLTYLQLGALGLWLPAGTPRLPRYLAFVIAALSPFMYFYLYLSYLSQSVSVTLLLFGVWAMERAARREELDWRASLFAGTIMGAALISHESLPVFVFGSLAALPVLMLLADRFLTDYFGTPVHKRVMAYSIAITALLPLLLATRFHIRIKQAIDYHTNMDHLLGGDWARLIDLGDVFGLSNALTAIFTPGNTVMPLWLYPLPLILLAIGLLNMRSLGLIVLLLGQTATLAIALAYVLLNVRAGTHYFAKTMSLFVFIFPFAAALGLARIVSLLHAERAFKTGALISLCLLWVWAEILAFRTWPPNAMMASWDTIRFFQKYRDTVTFAQANRALQEAILHRSGSLPMGPAAADAKAGVYCQALPSAIWLERGRLGSEVLDHSGISAYGQPPSFADYTLSEGGPWHAGFYYWEGRGRWVRAAASILLKVPQDTGNAVLLVRGHTQMEFVRELVPNAASQMVEVQVNGQVVGVMDMRSEMREFRFGIPASLLGSCKTAFVEFLAPVEYAAGGLKAGGRDARRIAWGVEKLGFMPADVKAQ